MYLFERLETIFTETWDGDYNSSIGRFISEDPLGFSGQDENLFRYTNNSGVNFIDPLGLQTISSPFPRFKRGRFGGGGGAIGGSIVIGLPIAPPPMPDNSQKLSDISKVFIKEERVPGDLDDAIDDFIDELIEGGAEDFDVVGEDKDIFIGTLPDGRKIRVRPRSSQESGNVPTIDFINPSGRVPKKRRYCGGNE